MTDGYGPRLSVLSEEECYRLLRSQTVGRLGVIADGYPLIFPVNYVMNRSSVLIRSRPGTKLTAADRQNVTFQVDKINSVEESGWSVLLRGQGEVVSAGPRDAIRMSAERSGLKPWVPGDDFQLVRVIPNGISGRRISPSAVNDWWWDTGAYM